MNSIVFSFRGDIRNVATILSYYTESGLDIRNRSELIGIAVQHLASLFISTNEVHKFETTTEAIRYLNQMGFYNPSDRKLKRTRVNQLIEEAKNLSDMVKRERGVSDELVREVEERIKEGIDPEELLKLGEKEDESREDD